MKIFYTSEEIAALIGLSASSLRKFAKKHNIQPTKVKTKRPSSKNPFLFSVKDYARIKELRAK